MGYKVTITQIVDEGFFDKGEWKKTATLWIPVTRYNELANWKEQQEWKSDGAGQYFKEIFDYVGGGNMIRKKEVEIYEQRVEDLDVKGVISAVLAGI